MKAVFITLFMLSIAPYFLLASAQAPESGPIAGGFQNASIKNPNVLKAYGVAKKAITTELGATKTKLVGAETQVVAGTNYKLTIAATNSTGVTTVEAVVYQPLPPNQAKFNVTSITPVDFVANTPVTPGTSPSKPVKPESISPTPAPAPPSSAIRAVFGIAAAAVAAVALF